MSHLCILLAVLLALVAPEKAAEPPLRIDNAAPADDVTHEYPDFFLTVTVFSTSVVDEPITLRQAIDVTRFAVGFMHADNGIFTLEPPSALRWVGTARRDRPVTLYLHLRLRPDAPPGRVALPVSGSDAHGHVAAATTTVRVCCVTAPDPAPPILRRFLPIARR